MQKILVFGASTSSSSINRKLATFAANQVPDSEVTCLDLRDYNLPIYSSDEEEENGIPADAHRFLEAIRARDGVIVSLAEHNGSYSAAFNNFFDWTSRIEPKLWSDRPMLLLATSPGARGGATVLESAKATFPRMGANLIASFELPSFYENFSNGESALSDAELNEFLTRAVVSFSQAM